MLLGDLFTYTIISQDEGLIKAKITINPTHNIFEGHFPGVPILPGVCQVQAIKEILEQVLNKTLRYNKVRDVKFMAMVTPDKMPSLNCEISYKPDSNDIKVNVLLTYNEQNILKLRGNLCQI